MQSRSGLGLCSTPPQRPTLLHLASHASLWGSEACCEPDASLQIKYDKCSRCPPRHSPPERSACTALVGQSSCSMWQAHGGLQQSQPGATYCTHRSSRPRGEQNKKACCILGLCHGNCFSRSLGKGLRPLRACDGKFHCGRVSSRTRDKDVSGAPLRQLGVVRALGEKDPRQRRRLQHAGAGCQLHLVRRMNACLPHHNLFYIGLVVCLVMFLFVHGVYN